MDSIDRPKADVENEFIGHANVMYIYVYIYIYIYTYAIAGLGLE